MDMNSHNLPLGQEHTFKKVYDAGSYIVFYSPSFNPFPDERVSQDNTFVNVRSAEHDNLLHVSFRRAENQIVFNSRKSRGNWGPEERVSLQGVFNKTDVTIAIRLEKDRYEVLINDSIIHTYKKRIIKDAQGVSYGSNSQSVFANPIGVLVASPESPIQRTPAPNYEKAYFTLTAKGVAETSEDEPFDYAIIGSGIGGGILAADLLEKNRCVSASSSNFSAQSTSHIARSVFDPSSTRALARDPDNRTKRILVIERGNLVFPTHSLNKERPINRGTYGQMNDLFYNHFKQDWEWGRVASEFRNSKKFDFAEGAYSTVDRLLEAAMDDQGRGKFKIVLSTLASHIEPKPNARTTQSATHVVVKDESGAEHKIRANNIVLSAGAVESPAILLRSMDGDDKVQAFGQEFARNFGHVTDHYIFYVTMPFYYKDAKARDTLGGVKLQTDVTFTNIDQSTALVNISLDASSFLPRRNIPDSELPQFIIAYTLPSQLHRDNSIEIDRNGRTRIDVGYAEHPQLREKKELLKDFAVDLMNKISAALDIQFVKHKSALDNYTLLPTVTKEHIELSELGPGGVAHELGSIPMPKPADDTSQRYRGTIVDENLKMLYGWNNVYVCDLSVFPHLPAANPTLSLAALSLRLSDHLVPPNQTRYRPIVIHNLSPSAVYVVMTLSNSASAWFNPEDNPETRVTIESGKSAKWKREQKETIFIYSSIDAKDFDVQIVYPGVTALITRNPPGP